MFQLAFDARSFAPFAFSPIAFAIQALVEEIREERVNGSGKARGRSKATQNRLQSAENGWKRGRIGGPSEDEVRAQWELLELRLANQQSSAAEQPPAPLVITRETAPAPAPLVSAVASESAAPAPSFDDEAAALVLLLAEA